MNACNHKNVQWNHSYKKINKTNKELLKQYEKYRLNKMQNEEKINRMQQQYTSMIAEKEQIIHNIRKEKDEAQNKTVAMKMQIKEAEKQSQLLK